DLKGKKIGIPAGSTQDQVWGAFLAVNGLEEGDVDVQNVEFSALQSSLLSHGVDGFLSFYITNVPHLQEQGVESPVVLKFADNGVPLSPDEGIVVNDETIKAKPDVLKRV